MEFHNKLYKIDSELGHDDVEALKFLCSDNLPAKKLSAVKSGIELFNLLLRNDSIQENNHFLLCELLYIIRQHHLLRILNTSKQKVYQDLQRVKQISPYRRMLYEISENITKDELNSMAFLLGDKVPRNQKEKMSVLDLLSHLEKNEIITEDNISALEGLLSHISLDLLRPISQYKLEKAATQRNENVPNTSLHYGTKGYDVLPPLSVQVVSSTDMESSIDDRDNVREHFQQVQGEAEKEGDKAVNFEDRVSQLNLHDNSTSQLSLYAMNRKHRGYCLIINNVHFMKSKVRKGTDKDAEDLKRVLTWLGLEVEIHNDRDAGDIRNCLKEFQSRDHTDSDCFVCCILSHGEPGVVLGSDDKTIEIHEMMSYFTPTNCPTLANKPKIFFIQACQGKEIQNAYPIETDASSSEVRKLTKNIPDDADFLLGMSTVKGFAALRHIQEGAWYIQALCDNLIEMVPRQEDILSILTKVNKDVSLKEDPKEGKKQMPQPAYTLTKKLIFPVPRLPFACT